MGTRDDILTPHRELLTSQCAQRCQLTPALLLRGLSIGFGSIPTHGLHTPGFLQNSYPYPSHGHVEEKNSRANDGNEIQQISSTGTCSMRAVMKIIHRKWIHYACYEQCDKRWNGEIKYGEYWPHLRQQCVHEDALPGGTSAPIMFACNIPTLYLSYVWFTILCWDCNERWSVQYPKLILWFPYGPRSHFTE